MFELSRPDKGTELGKDIVDKSGKIYIICMQNPTSLPCSTLYVNRDIFPFGLSAANNINIIKILESVTKIQQRKSNELDE